MLFLYKDRVVLTHNWARGGGAYDPVVERHVSITYVSDSNHSHCRLPPLHPSPVPSVTHRPPVVEPPHRLTRTVVHYQSIPLISAVKTFR
jgi:hypothetical protein